MNRDVGDLRETLSNFTIRLALLEAGNQQKNANIRTGAGGTIWSCVFLFGCETYQEWQRCYVETTRLAIGRVCLNRPRMRVMD